MLTSYYILIFIAFFLFNLDFYVLLTILGLFSSTSMVNGTKKIDHSPHLHYVHRRRFCVIVTRILSMVEVSSVMNLALILFNSKSSIAQSIEFFNDDCVKIIDCFNIKNDLDNSINDQSYLVSGLKLNFGECLKLSGGVNTNNILQNNIVYPLKNKINELNNNNVNINSNSFNHQVNVNWILKFNLLNRSGEIWVKLNQKDCDSSTTKKVESIDEERKPYSKNLRPDKVSIHRGDTETIYSPYSLITLSDDDANVIGNMRKDMNNIDAKFNVLRVLIED